MLINPRLYRRAAIEKHLVPRDEAVVPLLRPQSMRAPILLLLVMGVAAGSAAAFVRVPVHAPAVIAHGQAFAARAVVPVRIDGTIARVAGGRRVLFVQSGRRIATGVIVASDGNHARVRLNEPLRATRGEAVRVLVELGSEPLFERLLNSRVFPNFRSKEIQ